MFLNYLFVYLFFSIFALRKKHGDNACNTSTVKEEKVAGKPKGRWITTAESTLIL